MLALLSGPALAGPCADRIYRDQVAFDKRLDAAAAHGHAAAESTCAMLHHQPTPGSIAQAEAAAGDLSEADANGRGGGDGGGEKGRSQGR